MLYEKKYLELLSLEYPTVQAASSEIINLSAILHLPKGTEVFLADVHGEYDAFNHYLKNASGIIKEKIDLIFDNLSETARNRLAFFIYYPTDMLNKYQEKLAREKFLALIKDTLFQMIALCRHIVTKYTKSKVQKTLPKEFAYVITELLYESNSHEDKERYYNAIVEAIFQTKREKKFIVQISRFIRNLAVDRLHIVGDIFDRGPSPHLVMEKLLKKTNVDIQWGNHDISFLGAASGSEVMVANFIRIAARYNNLDCIEDGYGVNLLPLARFAAKVYRNDPCKEFYPRGDTCEYNTEEDLSFVAKIHKAIAMIQFKLEKRIISRHHEFGLDERLLLDKIDISKESVKINEKPYPLLDTCFPTVDFVKDPYRLTNEEKDVIDHLTQLFLHNEMLQEHARYMFQNGSMYLRYNNNLLFHADIPMNEDKTCKSFPIDGEEYQGKALFDALEMKIRQAYLDRYAKNNLNKDYFLFLWQSPYSPLFGKHQMKTFERYFIKEKETHKETNDPYYKLRVEPKVLRQIFIDFGMDPDKAKIINGHVPLDVTKGDEVVLANKKIYSIDGGMSKQYADRTSIGGYSMISDSHAYFLVSHERFQNYIQLIQEERDIVSVTRSEEINTTRTFLYDTDKGAEIKEKINDLYKLLEAYREGSIKEKA